MNHHLSLLHFALDIKYFLIYLLKFCYYLLCVYNQMDRFKDFVTILFTQKSIISISGPWNFSCWSLIRAVFTSKELRSNHWQPASNYTIFIYNECVALDAYSVRYSAEGKLWLPI